MRRRTSIVLAALAALCLARSAAAYTYGDTLTVIWKPLPNLPALARPGDSFTVWANAPSTATGFTASLQSGALVVPLTPAGGGWQSGLGRWVLSFQVPATLGAAGPPPEELYDLTLGCSACTPDVARNAVKVLSAYKSDFYFAQISDTHMPTHQFSSSQSFNPNDTAGLLDFDAVIDDLNLLHPEFILHTGDLVNEAELEEYLGMYEMGRALDRFDRAYDPIFLSSGNHDLGGWDPTPPPVGTARKNWWRYFGWPFLLNPPAGDPHHSQDYSFDYGLLHVIGLEAYINSGTYDDYHPEIWGAQSFTAEQLQWLASDVAAVPAGRTKLAFYHYDFGDQIVGSSGAAARGLDGAIWGHNHPIAEGNRAARPFNLGLQSVIDRRAFRIFRVTNGAISPGPMHWAGGTSSAPTDSLTTAWSGPNDGTRARLTATVTNRYGEAWNRAQVVFVMMENDSAYGATGGTIRQTIRDGGNVRVYVDCVLPASATTVVTVAPTTPLDVPVRPIPGLSLEPPSPNPFMPEAGALAVRFAINTPGTVNLAVYDVRGRLVATLARGMTPAGRHTVEWDGRPNGETLGAGLYFIRLVTPAGEVHRKLSLMP